VKFTRVVLICNLCWLETSGDAETPAERTLIFKTSDETDDFFRLDVCLNHASNGTTLDELIAAAEAVDSTTPPTRNAIGRPRKVNVSAVDPNRVVCPHCGNDFASNSGVSLHMKAVHPDAWAQVVIERAAEKERRNVEALNKKARML
jgi:hypothetical protein